MTDVPSTRSAPPSLTQLGWDAEWASAAAAAGGGGASRGGIPGRVVRVDRGLVAVLTASGPVRASLGGDLLAATAADRVATPVTGDWVVTRAWVDHRTTAERVLPRRTSVVRAGAGERAEGQPLVSNATIAAVVVGAVPDPGLAKVERLLALAWASGAQPLLVLAKADLVPDADAIVAELGADAPGVEAVVCSCATGEGIERLRALIGATGTLALLGSSGAGKSSLVNALVGAPVLRTRQLRDDGRGRHASVRRELVPLPGGGCVVDTPGLRGVGMAGTDAGVAAVFADIGELARSCRFADCTHDSEPGCAVRAASESGVVSVRRLEAWRRLQRELVWMARRHDARVRVLETRSSKARARGPGRPGGGRRPPRDGPLAR